jgi:putative addiction module killer protein
VKEFRQTREFTKWFKKLRDRDAKARILVRLDRLLLGNAGDFRSIGEGVCELLIDYGPGYRVYYIQQGNTVILLLAGGDKQTQSRDIDVALKLARNL